MGIQNWLYTLPLRLRSMLFRNRVDRELEDEFQYHLEQRIAAGVERGLSPEEARAEAVRALDSIALRMEECRETRGLNLLEGVARDLRYAVRVLRKSPAFTAVAILSLALGIGANTAIFSVMDLLVLRPLPVPRSDRLVLISLTGKFRPRYSFNYPMFELIRDRNQVFSQTFAWSVKQFQTPVGGDMLLVPGTYASGDYFAGLGVPPLAGRVLTRDDDLPSGGKYGAVAVISEGFWARRYGRSASAIGQSLVLNGVPVTIVGVMPGSFFGAEVGAAPDVWVPLNLQRQLEDPRCISNSSCWYLSVMGRLKPGVSEKQAVAELRTISPGVMADNHPPARKDRRADFLAQVVRAEPGAPGFSALRLQVRSPLFVLMALAGVVLLIACANMANLLTARASARHKEVMVRLAIGASRMRVVRQFVMESVLLALAGAALGLLVALSATRSLILILSTTAVLDLKPDWRVLLFTAAAAVGTGLVFGIVPALRATRAGIGGGLKERSSQILGAEGRFGLTRLLFAGQTALSIVLLAAAGLLAGSLVRLLNENPGFDPHGLTMVELDTTKVPEKGDALIGLYGRIMHATRALPEVQSASVMWPTPLTNSGWDDSMVIPGRPDLTEDKTNTDISVVGPGMLKTMKIPLLAGRDFNQSDTAHSLKVAIISEDAARQWFPDGALGKDVVMAMGKDAPTVRIVGIAGNIHYLNLREATPLTMYVPYTQAMQLGFVCLRTDAPVRRTYALFREMLRRVAPGTPIRTIRTMEQRLSESLSTERLTAYLSVYFAALALLLTAVGLYGILAYSVARRTGEIGIRMALGARPGSVVWLVIREALGHTAVGAVVGVGAVAVSAKLITRMLYRVQPNDPGTVVLSVAVLAAVCAVACWIPARRASRLDPMRALREE